MSAYHSLFLHEEILLLALRDEEGTIAGGMYQYAIGGALLAELLLQKRIATDEKKKKLVNLLSQTPLGDPLLDECLEKVNSAKRRASLETWVSRFAGIKNLKHRIAERLCQRGILRMDEDKILFLFTRKIYPEVNPGPEKEIINRLQDAVSGKTHDIDPRTVVLISLAYHADLLRNVIDKKELKERKEYIKQIIQGDLTGTAAKEAIEAVQAAIMIAVIMPAITAAAVTSS